MTAIDLKSQLKEALDKKKPALDNLKKEGVTKKHGGARKHSGRKVKEVTLIERGIKDWVDEHVKEEVDIKVRDPKTGKERIIKRTRLMVVLQKLYEAGVGPGGSVDAMKAWLDRALGRPMTVIGGDETKPFVLRLDL